MDRDISKLILAVILPPVAVYMKKGVSAHLFINIVLTLVGYIFGIAHAVWIVYGEQRMGYPVQT